MENMELVKLTPDKVCAYVYSCILVFVLSAVVELSLENLCGWPQKQKT